MTLSDREPGEALPVTREQVQSNPLLCPACGTRNAALGGGGLVVTVTLHDSAELAGLFAGELDQLRCKNEACGRPLAATPTVAAISARDRIAAIAPGSLAAGEDVELFEPLRRELAEQQISLDVVDGMSQLRGWIVNRWAAGLSALNRATQKDGEQDFGAFLQREWEALTPEAFVAAWLVASGLVEELQVQGVEGRAVDNDQVLGSYAQLQAKTWVALCMAWALPEERVSLEQDLRSYLPAGSLLPGAGPRGVEYLLELTRTVESQHLTYAVHAIRSTVCVRAGLTDPAAEGWATEWLNLEVLRHLTGEDDRPKVWDKLRVSPHRAQETVDHRYLFDAAAALFAKAGVGAFDALDAAGQRAGRQSLVRDLASAITPMKTKTLSAEQLIAAIEPSTKGRSMEPVLAGTNKLLELAPTEKVAETIWAVADAIAGWYGDSPEVRARVESWAGSHLSRRLLPNAFLERVGDRPRPQEIALSVHLRAHLAIERAGALHAAGRVTDATRIIDDLRSLVEQHPDQVDEAMRREVRLRRARLRRDAGEWESALAELRELADEAAGADRLDSLLSLASAYAQLGRTEEALVTLDEAHGMAAGPLRDRAARVEATRAVALAGLGRQQEAVDALMRVDEEALDELEVLVPYAAAWLSVAGALGDDPLRRERLLHTVQRLQEAWGATHESGAWAVHETLLRLLAVMSSIFPDAGGDAATPLWEALDVLCRELRGHADPMALIALAGLAAGRGDFDLVRGLLDDMVDALAGEYKAITRLSAVFGATHNLRWLLARLRGNIATSEAPLEFLRVVAELSRDVLGRLARPQAGTGQLAMPWDANLAAFGADIELAVLEAVTVEDAEGLLFLLTRVRNGEVTSELVDPPAVDLGDLGPRLTQKLRTWHAGRRGDPFDLAEWATFERWLMEQLGQRIDSDAHVVVIEHEHLADIPWHVAIMPGWTTSYATSWCQRLGSGPSSPSPLRRLGAVVVPRFKEAQEVLEVFGATVRAAQRLAHVGLQVDVVEGPEADLAAVKEVLETCDAVAVLCHGLVLPDEQIVSWLVAHDGTLPLKGSAEMATRHGRLHRFTWDDCDQLRSAPSLVVSAACSSGLAHYGGIGEQLGLFSALRRHGTRMMIAPRWDVPAPEVLPLLDQVLARVIRDAQPIAAAVREVARDVADQLPRWLTWALAVQGDWDRRPQDG